MRETCLLGISWPCKLFRVNLALFNLHLSSLTFSWKPMLYIYFRMDISFITELKKIHIHMYFDSWRVNVFDIKVSQNAIRLKILLKVMSKCHHILWLWIDTNGLEILIRSILPKLNYSSVEMSCTWKFRYLHCKTSSNFRLEDRSSFKILTIVCVDNNCKWMLCASTLKQFAIFKIRKFTDVHT